MLTVFEQEEIAAGDGGNTYATWTISEDLTTMDLDLTEKGREVGGFTEEGDDEAFQILVRNDNGTHRFDWGPPFHGMTAPADSSGDAAPITRFDFCVIDVDMGPYTSCEQIGRGTLIPRQEGADLGPGYRWNDYAGWAISEHGTTVTIEALTRHYDVGVVIIKGAGVADVGNHWEPEHSEGGYWTLPHSFTAPEAPSGEPAEIEYFELCASGSSGGSPPPDVSCDDVGGLESVFERQESASVAPGEHSGEYASWTVGSDGTTLDLEPLVEHPTLSHVVIQGVGVPAKWYDRRDDGFQGMTARPNLLDEPVEIQSFVVCTMDDEWPPPAKGPKPTETSTPTEEPVPTRIPSGTATGGGAGAGGADGSGNPVILLGLLLGTAAAVTGGLVIRRRLRLR